MKYFSYIKNTIITRKALLFELQAKLGFFFMGTVLLEKNDLNPKTDYVQKGIKYISAEKFK